MRPLRSEFDAERTRQRRGRRRRPPTARWRGDAFVAEHHAIVVDGADRRAGAYFDAELRAVPAPSPTAISGSSEHPRTGLEQQHARFARIDAAEFALERVRAISASVPASSTPVGPPPTMAKVSSTRRASGADSASARSNADRIRRRMCSASSSVFSPGMRGPVVVAEIRMGRAGGKQQEVVFERATVAEQHSRRSRLDRDHVFHQHGAVALPAQDVAKRRGDVRRRQAGGGDLVEQRLE